MSTLIIRRGMSKLAAAEDGPSFEQQFGILANAIIVEKYPKLDKMKLAFQLIEKRDDNNNAVGASIYMVGGTVIFIPAFYKKGDVNAGDMMFLAKTQQFIPLSDPWLAWVQGLELPKAGELTPNSNLVLDSGSSGQAVTVKDIADPIVKTACETACIYLKGLLRTDPDLTKHAAEHSLLDTVLGMGKRASEALLDNLVQNRDFLNATLRFYSPEDVDAFAKKASAMVQEEDLVKVILPFTKEAKELTPDEKRILDRDGYIIKTASADNPTVLRHSNIRGSFKVVSEPGKMTLLKMDGSVHPCLVLRSGRLDFDSARCAVECECWKPHLRPEMTASRVMHDTVGGQGGLVALLTTDVRKPEDLASDTMMLDTADNELFKPEMLASYGKALTPSNVKELDWNTTILCPDGRAYKVGFHVYARSEGWYSTWDNYSVVVSENQDQTSPIITSHIIILPQKSRALVPPENNDDKPVKVSEDMPVDAVSDKENVKYKHAMPLVTWGTFEVFLSNYINKNYRKVRVTASGNDIHVMGDREKDSDAPMSIKNASLHLVREYGVAPEIARSMIRECTVDRQGCNAKSELFLVTKTAADDMAWQNANIPMSEFQNRPEQREYVAMPTVVESPEQLQKAVVTAAENGIKDVFDVTAFKLLVRQNRFLEEIHDDLPLFMRVLDSLCRKLFLLYWHTEDFEDQYGTVKLKSLEDGLKTTIDSLSEITVFFKLRNINDDMGIGQDGGDLMRGYDI